MKKITFLIFFLGSLTINAQDFVTVKGDVLELNNGYVVRRIEMGDHALYSSFLSMRGSERNYIGKSKEFAFSVNGIFTDGSSGWDRVGSEMIKDESEKHPFPRNYGFTTFFVTKKLEGISIDVLYIIELDVVKNFQNFNGVEGCELITYLL